MRTCETGAGFGRRSVLILMMMMSLAAAGCGGGGGGGEATASNSNDAPPSAPPVSPFTPTTPDPSSPTPTTPTVPGTTPVPPTSAPPIEPPTVSDGGVTLSWSLPTATSTGAPLGTLAGFSIHYGQDANVLSETIVVDNPGLLTYVIDNLPAGTYYFAVRAVTTDGDRSALSNVISKVVS